jgi:hypothetical protein
LVDIGTRITAGLELAYHKSKYMSTKTKEELDANNPLISFSSCVDEILKSKSIPVEDVLKRSNALKKLPQMDSDEWLSMHPDALDKEMERLVVANKEGGKASARYKPVEAEVKMKPEYAKEAVEEMKMRLGTLINGSSGLDGVDNMKDISVPTEGLQYDEAKVISILESYATTGSVTGVANIDNTNKDRIDKDNNALNAYFSDEDDDDNDDNNMSENRASNNVKKSMKTPDVKCSFKDIMEAMDHELLGFSTDANESENENESGSGSGSEEIDSVLRDTFTTSESGHSYDGSEDTDIDYHVLANLLKSNMAQAGQTGPVSNMLSQLGINMDDLMRGIEDLDDEKNEEMKRK